MLLKDSGVALTLQNGVGNYTVLSESLGKSRYGSRVCLLKMAQHRIDKVDTNRLSEVTPLSSEFAAKCEKRFTICCVVNFFSAMLSIEDRKIK